MKKRLYRIFLLILCTIRAIFYGVARKAPSKISRIIVVPDGKLGDLVCATPVFLAIRKHFSQAHIIVVGDTKLLQSLFSDSGLVDEYSELGPLEADIALLTGPSFEAAATLYLSGVPFISAPEVSGGFSPLVTRPYKILLNFLRAYSYQMREYAPRQKLRSLESLGITENDTTKHLGFSKEASEKVSRLFNKDEFVVGITPTAGHKIKEWPEERFAEVADYLVEKYHTKVLMLGGPKDKEKVQKTLSFMKNEATPITDLNLDELKALISKLHLFISVDTGPIYIAEAFDIPTIDITGPIDEREQPPIGPLHRNVIPQDRLRPELFVLNAKSYNREEALRQVMSISALQVKNEIDLLIRDLKRG